MAKRVFDILIAVILIVLLAPLIVVLVIFILIKDGRPIFYVSERMKGANKSFRLVKFRTMVTVQNDDGATGAHKQGRITKSGERLRRLRLDEIPQLWNILKGDMSFVGPRPPLRKYVVKYPELYGEVLRARPGITGLASIYFHRHEEWLLKNSSSAEETEVIYCNSCIPRKAKLDLMYIANRNLCFDFVLMIRTIIKVFT